jgi:hypothetical protein
LIRFTKLIYIPIDFLKVQPEKWNDLEGYNKGKLLTDLIKVVNDTAELRIKLMEEYYNKFTKNEEQKQFF